MLYLAPFTYEDLLHSLLAKLIEITNAAAAIKEGRKSRNLLLEAAILRISNEMVSIVKSFYISASLMNLSRNWSGLRMLNSKSNFLRTSPSHLITLFLVMNSLSSSSRSLIILFMEGVMGYSSLAAKMVQVTTSSTSYSLLIVVSRHT